MATRDASGITFRARFGNVTALDIRNSASAAAGPRLDSSARSARRAGKLRLDWSPEQIAGWLKRTHPEDGCNQVSHETIYRSLFVQARGVLKKELLSHLRSKRSMRRSRPVDPNGDKRGHIKDIVSIRQRPAAVEDRAVPGHWEGDLLSGPNNSYIATLVERHTRYVMLAKVAGQGHPDGSLRAHQAGQEATKGAV